MLKQKAQFTWDDEVCQAFQSLKEYLGGLSQMVSLNNGEPRRRRVEKMNVYVVCFQLKRVRYLQGEPTVKASEEAEKLEKNRGSQVTE